MSRAAVAPLFRLLKEPTFRAYEAIDPRLTPQEAKPALLAIFEDPELAYDSVTRCYIGVMAAEIAVASEGDEAQRWLSVAHDCLELPVENDVQTTIKVRDTLRATDMVVGNDGNTGWSPALISTCTRYLRSDSEQAGRNYLGHLGDEVTVGVLHSPQDGLASYPAFMRQEVRVTPVDGKKYTCDVTLESNGLRVDRGIYRLQVELTGTSHKPDEYHPDIHVLPLTEIIGRSDETPARTVVEAALAVINGDSLGVMESRDRLLEVIGERPPASPATPILDRLQMTVSTDD